MWDIRREINIYSVKRKNERLENNDQSARTKYTVTNFSVLQLGTDQRKM